MNCLVFLVAVCVLGVSHAYPGGPPTGACESMTPRHGPQPQNLTTNPYMIEVNSQCYKARHEIEVKISHKDGAPFKGFFVQARSGSDTQKSYGMFRQYGPGQKQLSCFDQDMNAISHSSRDNKDKSEFMWIAPDNYMMDIHFVVTVVQTRDVFWVKIPSAKIMYKNDCGGSTGPQPTRRPPISAAPGHACSVVGIMVALFAIMLFN